MGTLLSDGSSGVHTTDVSTGALDTGITLGMFLRSAREHRGLTVQQVANETKISQHRLEELEHDTVPPTRNEFYRRAEIRAYARAVHCDEHLAMAEFDRSAHASVPPERVQGSRSVRLPRFLAKSLFMMVAVVVTATVLGRAMNGPPASVVGPHSQAASVNSSLPKPLGAVPLRPVSEGVTVLQRTQLDQPRPSSRPEIEKRPAPSVIEQASADGSSDPTSPQRQAGQPAVDSETELIVTTDPQGARVTVNGIGWGTTPVTIRYLSAGIKRIRVTKDGYTGEERVVRLVDGAAKALDIRLSAIQ